MKPRRTPVAPALLAAALTGLALPAFAQHEGHTMSPPPTPVEQPEPGPAGAHAGQSAPPQPAESGAPEAGTPHGQETAPHDQSMDHSMHQMAPAASPSAAALTGPIHAADMLFDPRAMDAARAQLRREHGGFTTRMLLADRVESGTGDGPDQYRWDLQGWAGSDLDRFWWKTEGAGESGRSADDFEIQALYSRAMTPFFDIQTGLRYDAEPGPGRTHAVLGVQGLLPYVFEIDAAVFLSDESDWTARFEAEYDLRILQRLVLQPRIELNFSGQTIPALGLGPGLGSVDGGLRLRYEIRRELAPYIGIEWTRLHGSTADFARAASSDTRVRQAVVGLRAWF